MLAANGEVVARDLVLLKCLHEAIQIAFSARCISLPNQFEHGLTISHRRCPG